MKYQGDRPKKDLRKVKRSELQVTTNLALATLIELMKRLELFTADLYKAKRTGTMFALRERIIALLNSREVEELKVMLDTFTNDTPDQGVSEKEER